MVFRTAVPKVSHGALIPGMFVSVLKAIVQKTPSTSIVVWFGWLWLALIFLFDSARFGWGVVVHLVFVFVSFYERFVLFCFA